MSVNDLSVAIFVGNGRMVKEDGHGQKGLAEEGRSGISEVGSVNFVIRIIITFSSDVTKKRSSD